MIIMSEDRRTIINFDNVTSVNVINEYGSDDEINVIKASKVRCYLSNGNYCDMASYPGRVGEIKAKEVIAEIALWFYGKDCLFYQIPELEVPEE